MRILHVTHEFPAAGRSCGGTGRYVEALARAQRELGHTPAVLTCDPDPARPHARLARDRTAEGIPVHSVAVNRYDAPEQLYRREDLRGPLQEVLGSAAWDLVHIHHFQGLTGTVAEIARERGLRYGVTLHDFATLCVRAHMIDYAWQTYDCARMGYGRDDCVRCLQACHFPGCRLTPAVRQTLAAYLENRRRYFAEILAAAAWVTAPSRFVKAVCERGFGPQGPRIRVEPLGLEPAPPPPDKSGLPWITFGYLGSIDRRKGIELLLRAFRDLPYPLHIWGRDPREPALAEYAATRPNLTYHGPYRAPDDLADIFARIHVCVIPSLSEAFGITLRESLAHHVPVIASDWSGLAEGVEPGRTGLLFEVGDEASLRDALIHAASHPEEVRAMADRAARSVLSLEEHARRLLALTVRS